MKRWAWVLLVVGVSLLGLSVVAQEGGGLNIAFVFDASGSMMAAMEGRTRLAVAQDAMAELTASLPENANTSLWVYGHRLSQDDPAASCQDIEEVIALGPHDPAQFESTVRGLNAIGYTPITDSLQLAAQTLVDRQTDRNTIVLISDGEETCGGSPCLMAQALKEANIELTVNTIGFAPDDVTRQQLECIADVTGGIYYEADDSVELTEALQAAVTVPGDVRLVDPAGEPVTDVSFEAFSQATGESVGTYTGSASLPPGDYRVAVQSDPPMEAVIGVISGETTDIFLPGPALSGIQMVDLAGEPLPEMNVSIVDAVSGDWLDGGTGTFQTAPGDYHIRVDTAFPQEFDVTVVEGELTPVQVDPAEGAVRIVDLNGDSLPEMYFNVTDPATGMVYYGQGEMRVPPGTFPVEVSTAFATRTEATVVDGVTTDVPVDTAFGTIVLTDLTGEPQSDVSFNILGEGMDEPIYGQGQIDVPPGTYTLNISSQPPITVDVTVADGQRLEVPITTDVGTIRIVDLDGSPAPDVGFTISDPAVGDLGYGRGEFQVPPGEYTVIVDLIFPVETTVTVLPGEISDIAVEASVGTVQLLNTEGEPENELAFELWLAEGQSIYGRSPLAAPPGDYRFQLQEGIQYETEITVVADETTEVVLPSTGFLRLVDENGNPVTDVLYTAIETVTGERTAAQGEVELPPGSYTVEVMTVFPFVTEIEVLAGRTNDVAIDTTVGTIQLVDEEGSPLPELLYSVLRQETGESTASTGAKELPPGLYTVEVFTVFPFETEVEVIAGETAEVVIDTAAGTVQLVDGRGRPQPSVLFTVTRQETGESAAVTGEIDVPPGIYTVEVLNDKPFEIEVEVLDGEVTNVNIVNATTDRPAP